MSMFRMATIFYVISWIVIAAGLLIGILWGNWITAFVGSGLFVAVVCWLMLAPKERRKNDERV